MKPKTHKHTLFQKKTSPNAQSHPSCALPIPHRFVVDRLFPPAVDDGGTAVDEDDLRSEASTTIDEEPRPAESTVSLPDHLATIASVEQLNAKNVGILVAKHGPSKTHNHNF